MRSLHTSHLSTSLSYPPPLPSLGNAWCVSSSLLGHGTHVSGTAAGEDPSPADDQDGHASGAKIAFFDMGDSAEPDYIYYPEPLGSSVFQPAYDAGARIHTNSWGGPFNQYDEMAVEIDDFLNQHDDFLVLFAAGNDGEEGFYSLGNPATSKNGMAIGASESNPASNIDYVAYFSGLGPTFDERIKV